MMKLRLMFLTIFLVFQIATCFGQVESDKTTIDTFIKRFPILSLPDTIQYSYSEFGYGYYEPYESAYTEDSIEVLVTKENFISEFQDRVLYKDVSLEISYELVEKFLLTELEHALIYVKGESMDTIYPTYYVSNRILTTGNFYCLVYEMQCELYNQKYICTISKEGKLIDKIKIASANPNKTAGILRDSTYYAFFSDGKSILTKTLTIYSFTDGIHSESVVAGKKGEIKSDSVYQIMGNGTIKNVTKKK